MVLCGIKRDDNILDIKSLVPKLLKTRLWEDGKGRAWGKNVVENDYQIMLVSQFTLYNKFKGTKPDFHLAMQGLPAKELYEQFLKDLSHEYKAMQSKLKIKTKKRDPVLPGAFGQHMNIEMVNDGPVTLVIESKKDPKEVKKLAARTLMGKKAE